MTDRNTIIQNIAESVKKIPILSSHEHLCYEADAIEAVSSGISDILHLFTIHYIRSDFISAGAKEADLDYIGASDKPMLKRFEVFRRIADRCLNTTQFRSLRKGLSDLYDGDILNASDMQRMDELRKNMHRPGVYKKVLQEKAGIKKMVRDCGPHFEEPEYFSVAVRLEEWLGVSSANELRVLEAESGIAIHGLADMVDAFRNQAEKFIDKGIACFKSAMLYWRDPVVAPVIRDDAERAFQRMVQTRTAEWNVGKLAWSPELRSLQDYLVYELCDIASSRKVPLQVHTGIPEGNCLSCDRGNPLKIFNLIQSFPTLEFHLLHMGHPYEREVVSASKSFPNVIVDCSWIHQLNQVSAQFYLDYLLDEVPRWKIIAFGGDYGHMEGVYSSSIIARLNISSVFMKRIERGACNFEEALETAHMLLFTNPNRHLFKNQL
ncbi:MAG: amidohydrolase family protein [Deltaproteobacteria bacterium]|nr:amidohydrolase family protein [Deltaproteobacteria bacterium]